MTVMRSSNIYFKEPSRKRLLTLMKVMNRLFKDWDELSDNESKMIEI